MAVLRWYFRQHNILVLICFKVVQPERLHDILLPPSLRAWIPQQRPEVNLPQYDLVRSPKLSRHHLRHLCSAISLCAVHESTVLRSKYCDQMKCLSRQSWKFAVSMGVPKVLPKPRALSPSAFPSPPTALHIVLGARSGSTYGNSVCARSLLPPLRSVSKTCRKS